jgi:soluble lytic murein transglycosylase-like protein
MNREKFLFFFVSGLILFGVFFKKEIYETGVTVYEYMKSLYDDIFKKWASLRGLDWKLLRAFATVESNLKETAIGDNGRSIGLMQVQLIIGQAYAGVSDLTELYDPDKNVEAGSGYIADLMSKYGDDLDSVIQAYNLGETKFNKGYLSLDYLAKVKTEYETLKGVEI